MNVRSPLLRGAVGTAICAWLCAAYVSPARASDLEALLACRQIAPSAARLSCFDRESAALAEDVRAGAPPPSAATGATGATGATAATASRLNPQQTFGLAPMQVVASEAAAERLPHQLDRLSAHIAALGRAADGREIFTLDNHQVWAQLEPDESIIARAGDPVTISRGMFSSYWLSLPARQGCKVTRMR
jgi:hypothetical protein